MNGLPNAAERERLLSAARLTVRALEALPVLTPCAQCAEFRDGYCERWKASVPPENQAAGCAEWCEPIPF